MADKKTRRNEQQRKPQPTVQHQSSANNAQDFGIRESPLLKHETITTSSHKKRRHSGSDGADQERGSNH